MAGITDPRDLNAALGEFDASIRAQSDSALNQQWAALRGRLDSIIDARRFPWIARQLGQPVILIATPEIVSLPENMGNLSNMITTGDGGGLADISAVVVTELFRQGVNVHIALPNYKNLFASLGELKYEKYRALLRGVHEVDRIHLISDVLFERATRVYDEDSRLDRLNLRKANAFMRGIIYDLLPKLASENDHVLVHCNDWMTGLLPAAARSHGVRSLMTFHNIFSEFQSPHGLHKHGIGTEPFQKHLYFKNHPDSYADPEEHYKKNEVDFMTSGLFASDRINTVSPTFLKELVDGVFDDIRLVPAPMLRVIRERYRAGRASGILNAPTLLADPKLDPLIHKNYGEKDLVLGKKSNKLDFQKKMGLAVKRDAPLFYWPHRLSSPQKGIELVFRAIPALMRKHEGIQFAFVANGQTDLTRECRRLVRVYPGQVAYMAFTRNLSQLGKAAADFILSPSLYEPCGIPQVEGPRYATLPIVRRTGGLADTVEELGHGRGNGFVFEPFSADALARAISRAVEFYQGPAPAKRRILTRVMRESFERFNAKNTVNAYIALYEEILERPVR